MTSRAYLALSSRPVGPLALTSLSTQDFGENLESMQASGARFATGLHQDIHGQSMDVNLESVR